MEENKLIGYSRSEKAKIGIAFDIAKRIHHGEVRLSGEPNLVHIKATTEIALSLRSDVDTVVLSLLHEAPKSSATHLETIEKGLGPNMNQMVASMLDFGRLKYKGVHRHSESMRKLLVADARDLRCVVVRLLCRLHNMRTLKYVLPHKQFRIAKETLDIYAPIAHRLGIRKVSRELEDLAFPFVYKNHYEALTEEFSPDYESNLAYLKKFRDKVGKRLATARISKFRCEYRVKGLYSIYRKRAKLKKVKIYDLFAMRVIVDNVEDCYRTLGILHSLYPPMDTRIKDYISFPKQNGYRSLHTVVVTEIGIMVEVQIRTNEMHTEAEFGAMSHIGYKSDTSAKKISFWLESLTERHSGAKGRSNILDQRIFVFTPKGDVIDLPLGSTVIDFAYTVHSDVGNCAVGARINGEYKSVTSALKNKDTVEVITDKKSKPNSKWLQVIKSSIAKRHLKYYFERHKEEKIRPIPK